MKGLSWSDNICTVGWTSIYGSFTLADMQELLGLHPEGSFTPTFSGIGLGYTNEELFSRLKEEGWDDVEHGFYFQFPWQGSEALVSYLLMKDIEMEPEVRVKVKKHHDDYWQRVMRTL